MEYNVKALGVQERSTWEYKNGEKGVEEVVVKVLQFHQSKWSTIQYHKFKVR